MVNEFFDRLKGVQPPLKVVAHCSPFLGWGLSETLCHIFLCKRSLVLMWYTLKESPKRVCLSVMLENWSRKMILCARSVESELAVGFLVVAKQIAGESDGCSPQNRVGFFWLREGDAATFLPLKYWQKNVVCHLQDHPVDLLGNLKRASNPQRQWFCIGEELYPNSPHFSDWEVAPNELDLHTMGLNGCQINVKGVNKSLDTRTQHLIHDLVFFEFTLCFNFFL